MSQTLTTRLGKKRRTQSPQVPLAKKSHVSISEQRVSNDILFVKQLLSSLVEAKEADRWLSTPNMLLGGLQPSESIRQGRTSQVIEILARVEEGIYV